MLAPLVKLVEWDRLSSRGKTVGQDEGSKQRLLFTLTSILASTEAKLPKLEGAFPQLQDVASAHEGHAGEHVKAEGDGGAWGGRQQQ